MNRHSRAHQQAAMDAHGPTMAYLSATQPGCITALVWGATVFLVVGALSAIVMCAHMIATEARDPNPLLGALFAIGIVGGMALLVPMLCYRIAADLPLVFQHQFVRPGSRRLLPVWGAYLIVFFVSVPLLIDEYGGRRMPDWFEAYGRLLVELYGMARWIL